MRKLYHMDFTGYIKKIATLAVLLVLSAPLCAQYLHVSGKKIVDGDGHEVILRGMGLGGWMLQEGYMLQTNGFANSQREIRAAITGLIGESNTNAFYDAWLANHCTKADIDSLAAWGFNSVRLPMHYNLYTLPIEQEPVAGQHTWLEKGFALTDSLVKWCKANSMYVILDLHAAPGGQGRDAAISDYDPARPSLWESDANRQKTIALWRKLAERYADEPWIGGYDLINETNWNFTPGAHANGCEETTNAPLRALLVAITNAIREVDTHHIIFIEGNCWANNHNGLMPPWDNNMVSSFHKYWNNNDQGAVQGWINERNAHNIPLWLGESGENSNDWFAGAIKLSETNDVGWAWWPLKKVGSIVNPLTVVKNAGYEALLDYWRNGGTKPPVAEAKAALMQLTENLKIANNIYRKDVIDAMFRQVQTDATKPFAMLIVPGVVPAPDYDMGRNGKAYYDKDAATYHVSTNVHTTWNNGHEYRNDGVDIQVSSDTDAGANGYNVGWTEDGEWLQYTIQVDSSAAYNIAVRYATPGSASKIKLQCNGVDITGPVALPSTGGYQAWKETVLPDVVLTKGTQALKVMIEKGGFNFSLIKFALSKKTADVPMKAIGGEIKEEDMKIRLNMNKKPDPATLAGGGFTVTVNSQPVTVTALAVSSENPQQLVFTLPGNFYDSDVINVTYAGTAAKALDGTLLENFTGLTITNSLPVHYAVPGKIEAENFSHNAGLQPETTTDTGGGQNMGFADAGDYLEYRVHVAQTGLYQLELRVASQNSAGRVEIAQYNEAGTKLDSELADLPVTGGWQAWQTVKKNINLAEGRGRLRLRVVNGGFNINWLRFTHVVVSGTKNNAQGRLKLYPNPVHERLEIEIPESAWGAKTVTVKNMQGAVIRRLQLADDTTLYHLDVGGLSKGLYIVELALVDRRWRNRVVVQ